MVYAKMDLGVRLASLKSAESASRDIPGTLDEAKIIRSESSPVKRLLGNLLAYDTLQDELHEGFGLRPSQIEFSDQKYVIPSHEWLVSEFIPYSQKYFAINDFDVTGEGMDCDNVARLFRNQLVISNVAGGRAGDGDIACGVIKVKQNKPFGGVHTTNSAHSLLIIRTELGWQAIEPQTGTVATLQTYPNTDYIEWLLL